MRTYDIMIIGGGVSGLSAGVELCAQGHKVLLLEQHRYCGGRAHSFIDAATGDTIDNGQHLMMGCYHATRRYMHMIGTEHLTELQPTLQIGFLHPSENSAFLYCPSLKAPLHILGGLMRFKGIPWKNRIEMLRVAKELFYTSSSKEQKLDQLTAEEWLTTLGQSSLSRKFFWDVIAFGALNNHPQALSALLLFRVLRVVFLGNREHSSFLFPRASLSEVLVNPAVEFIRQKGGEVLLGKEVAKFHLQQNKITSVVTRDGKRFHARVFLSTVPWFVLDRLFSDSAINVASTMKTSSRESCNLDRFTASPIISIHLWLDRIILEKEFAALIDTRVQWMFNKSWKAQNQLSSEAVNQRKRKRQHLSLVISGAHEFVELSKKELLTIAIRDIRNVLPKMKDARVIHSIVIKEKRATFSPVPGLETVRPLPKTSISNLFLAGDWTATGYPATIEGAAMSGRKAAEEIHQYIAPLR